MNLIVKSINRKKHFSPKSRFKCQLCSRWKHQQRLRSHGLQDASKLALMSVIEKLSAVSFESNPIWSKVIMVIFTARLYMIPVSRLLHCKYYRLLHWPYGGRLAALNVSWQKKTIELQAGTFGVWNTFSCRSKKPTPSTLIGSMMVIKVLLIRVPACYDIDTLSLLHWNRIWLMMVIWLTHPCSTTLWAPDHSTWIIMRQCKDKCHISHPQEMPQSTSTGGRGKGVKMGT